MPFSQPPPLHQRGRPHTPYAEALEGLGEARALLVREPLEERDKGVAADIRQAGLAQVSLLALARLLLRLELEADRLHLRGDVLARRERELQQPELLPIGEALHGPRGRPARRPAGHARRKTVGHRHPSRGAGSQLKIIMSASLSAGG
jgi:hypothetical protein